MTIDNVSRGGHFLKISVFTVVCIVDIYIYIYYTVNKNTDLFLLDINNNILYIVFFFSIDLKSTG